MTLKPRFYLILILLLGVAFPFLLRMWLSEPVPVSITAPPVDVRHLQTIDSLKTALYAAQEQMDSVLNESQMERDTVYRFITRYKTTHDTIQKLALCDSIVEAAQDLVEYSLKSDSLCRSQILQSNQVITKQSAAMDTCSARYNRLADDYSALQKSTVHSSRIKNIAVGAAAAAVAEFVIIIFRK